MQTEFYSNNIVFIVLSTASFARALCLLMRTNSHLFSHLKNSSPALLIDSRVKFFSLKLLTETSKDGKHVTRTPEAALQ